MAICRRIAWQVVLAIGGRHDRWPMATGGPRSWRAQYQIHHRRCAIQPAQGSLMAVCHYHPARKPIRWAMPEV